MDRSDFQQLADLRIGDAEVLMAGDRPEAAYYLGGYAVECALKACVARQTKEHEFPDRRRVNDSYTHDLDQLLQVAGLVRLFEERAATDPRFEENWLLVKEWTEGSRYERRADSEARTLLAAVMDEDHGVLPWLKGYW